MIAIPQPETTIARIYRAYENRENGRPRAHLGASLISRACEREAWLSFRWASYPDYDGRILRLFDRGKREEPVFIRDLRDAGAEVHDVDPATGKQFSFAEFGGHVGGSTDGAAIGLVEAPKTWHVLEFKTHNAASFAALRKDGVAKTHPDHVGQMQLYMGWSGMTRALYLAVCKDTDELYAERLQFDRAAFESLREKARRVVFAKEPLPRLSDSPAFYKCKLCMFHDVCHGLAFSRRNCRTCAFSTPREDGAWYCERRQQALALDDQSNACGDHIFIPPLLPWPVHNVADKCPCYETPAGLFANTPDCIAGPAGVVGFTSRELERLTPEQLPAIIKAKKAFGGEVCHAP